MRQGVCRDVLKGFTRMQRKVCVCVVTQTVSSVTGRTLTTATPALILRARCSAGRVCQPVPHKRTGTAGLGSVWVSINTHTHTHTHEETPSIMPSKQYACDWMT